MVNKNFAWNRNGQPPDLKSHSRKKLDVIEQYVRVYIKTLASDPRIDKMAVSIVDTFSGGGVYSAGRGFEYGSPLRLIRAVNAAEAELNLDRRKPFRVQARYFFSDTNKEHVHCLRTALEQSEFRDEIGQSISLTTGVSSDILPSVVSQIRGLPGNTRSLFVLDQFGYMDVPMADIQLILQSLQNAEIILTFSIDGLLNYLTDKGNRSEKLSQFGIDPEFIQSWHLRDRDDENARATAQRILMGRLHKLSRAQFFTPFLLFSPGENRMIMLAHLSRHQKARDKMLGVHWDRQNNFRHYGSGGRYRLSYDSRHLDSDNALFSFREEDRQKMKKQLEDELPSRLFGMMEEDKITVKNFLYSVGNDTAAQNDDLLSVVREMAMDRAVQVLGPNDEVRKTKTLPKIGDLIIKPAQKNLSFPRPTLQQ